MSQTGEVTEVILATNFTNEGEATAHYVAEMLCARDLRVSRMRGSRWVENTNTWDVGTLSQALLDHRGIE